ncbi:GNAT family N-acetyltransferase [Clostridium bornimense]|uniref:GNAT family N-acetyltransferase n=1 Tax=Clostridium bornimense TaxID=1216932 RepID=UPI00345F5038
MFEMIKIWNEVVNDGKAFPQVEELSVEEANKFFADQSFCAVAEIDSEVVVLYILHPNNIGRCGHIANSSYAVKSSKRGNNIGEKLVRHSLEKAKELGFRIMQFNAVVSSNKGAIHLYEKIGFEKVGVVKKGFLNKDNKYEDIILFYYDVEENL